MYCIKVFSISDPDRAQEVMDEWISEIYNDYEHVEIFSISQSETSAGSDFYHLTISVVWKGE